jgi:hypothetical protein
MGADVSELPPGFVLDQPPQQQAPSLPPGFVLDEPAASKPPEPDKRDSLLGKVDATVRGAADFLTFGMADEMAAGADALFHPVLGTGQDGGSISERYSHNLEAQRATDKADEEKRGGYRLGGQLAGGLAGGIGMAGAGLLPSVNAARGGAGLLPVAGLSALEGGAMGAAQGFGSGEGADDRTSKGWEGGKLGSLFGLGAPVATAAVAGAARRAVTPFASNATREGMVNTLAHEGVDVTAGQRTGSYGLRYAENELGGRAAQGAMERQGEQFTAAALRRTGTNAPRATPDVIDDAFTRVGQQFDDLAARNTLTADRQLGADLAVTFRDYAALVPESQRAPVVQGILQDIVGAAHANNGALPGAAYQAARSRLDRMARGAASDPQLSDALRGIRNALDDAMERSISPQDAAAWREARNQYRNLIVVERAATGAGENAAMGIISPSQLRNATVTAHGRRNYARGDGDFAELARSGEAILKPLPNSGTAGRLKAQGLTTAIPSILGSGVGGTAGGIPGALAGAAAGAVTPQLLGALIMSRAGQAYLGNQIAPQITPNVQALINAIANREQSALVGSTR